MQINTMSTVAQIFAKTLKEMGVRFVFGVPSGNMTDYIEALREVHGIDFILVGHEATASFMAGVCGKLTGIPGVCFATFGPGATNLSTGVGGALLDRLPLIAFTDEMPDNLRHRTVQMNIDHQQLFRPLTKWTSRLAINNIESACLHISHVKVAVVIQASRKRVISGIILYDHRRRPIHIRRFSPTQAYFTGRLAIQAHQPPGISAIIEPQ